MTNTGDYKLEQMNVKTTFLHGNINENLLMEQLEGLKIEEKEDYVCLIKKSLCDLK